MLDHQFWEAVFLGIIQGATEFLPISSSAHLILVPWLLGWEAMGLSFDVTVHAGTLLAVLIYFRHDWSQLVKEVLGRPQDPGKNRPRLIRPLIWGTLPALIFGGLMQGVITQYLRSPLVTVFTLSGFGLFLWLADRTGRQERGLGGLVAQDGLLIGMAQAWALIPGVSRSGVTISAALMLGFSRTESARFSFLLGTPLIALAAMKQFYELWQAPASASPAATSLVAGVVFSFLSGLLCIKYFLRFLRARTYLPFVLYRLLLAVFIFCWVFWGV